MIISTMVILITIINFNYNFILMTIITLIIIKELATLIIKTKIPKMITIISIFFLKIIVFNNNK